MNIEIDSKKLKSRPSRIHPTWKIWEKKNLNIHRGVVQWSVDRKFKTVAEIADHIRAGIKDEFSPGWFRGFGFGTILRLHEVPDDFKDICNHIDKRANTKGVWQWSIMLFERDKFALGVHTWQHGFLHPIYESVINQLQKNGYRCETTDTDVDAFLAKLMKVRRTISIVTSTLGDGP